MAARQIPDLDSISEVNSADLLLIVDENVDLGTYFKVTVDSLAAFIGENYTQLAGNAVGNINMSGFTFLAGNIQCYTEGNITCISPLAMSGNSFYMNTGGGTGGTTLYMDGGIISFPNTSGSYGDGTGSTIQTGRFSNGEEDAGGGLSFICWAGVELNWQGGWLSASTNSGDSFQNINMYQTGFNMQGNIFNLNAGAGSGGGNINLDGGSIFATVDGGTTGTILNDNDGGWNIIDDGGNILQWNQWDNNGLSVQGNIYFNGTYYFYMNNSSIIDPDYGNESVIYNAGIFSGGLNAVGNAVNMNTGGGTGGATLSIDGGNITNIASSGLQITDGFNGSGTYTTFTIINGIITSAS